MYDLKTFTQENMYDCAIALRNMNAGAKSMEDMANQIVRYLHSSLIDQHSGTPACALVRFFKTHAYKGLDPELQDAAQAILKGRSIVGATKCLTLLATAGDEPYWNSRRKSMGHQAIPLMDEDFVRRAPMILQLIQQFGLDVSTVIDTAPTLITDIERTTFNVFYVPEAYNSPYIPAQREFVIPYQIQSVLGFGGMLSTGDLFAIILFSKISISPATANLFKWIAAYVRIPTASFAQENVFGAS
ncbi:MAG: histidine kinase [Lyngbya sp. HA4199-MV5]|jgi:hypothetical protein|nr:histidine kinase [Lyngbya sp. HA4199-MV5]